MPRPRTGGPVFKENPKGEHYYKPKTGPRKGKRLRGDWYARVKWTEDGRQKSIWKAADNQNDARDKCRQILNDIERQAKDKAEGINPTPKRTFAELADYYELRYLKPAEYSGDRKVAGLRSLDSQERFMKTLRGYFKERPLRSITHGDVESFKAHRLKTEKRVRFKDEDGAWQERPAGKRSLASVHRELALLRRMFSVAKRENWIEEHPFRRGDTLISLADEQKRQRILSLDEEDKLLAACVDERAHLKAILICALDTGMRQGEIFKLTWGQVDLEHRTITISAFNTKTLQQRSVPVSERLAAELTRLYTTRPHEPAQSVFGISNNVKRSFAQVKDKAGVKGLRFHDLRHSAATRLVQFGLSLPEVGRLLGHSQPATTYRYVNADGNTLEHAKQIMDNLHKPTKQPPAQPTT